VSGAELAEQALQARLELPLAVRGVGLIDVEVHRQRHARGLGEELQLFDVAMSDHSSSSPLPDPSMGCLTTPAR